MAPIPFTKGNGAGNDFLVLHDPDDRADLTPASTALLCDRRTGIGADGLLRAVRCARSPEAHPYAGRATWFMDYRNPDGSLGEMCGNGMRVLARHLTHHGHSAPGRLTLATRVGLRTVDIADAEPTGDVTVHMGQPHLPLGDGALTVTADGRCWPARYVDVGNPHAVAFVDDLAHPGSLASPPAVTPRPPQGVTVEFVRVLAPGHLSLRVHERGVGETPACGTGACAAVTAAHRTGHRPRDGKYRVDAPGGTLHVRVLPDGSHTLTGPTVLTVSGFLTAHADA
ncbi:diaminopimelate epimerase [Streptomyces sp. B-S-A8]|uniref:Diaminopimelate epimerase n=1 Tax=Streptomyces solicavernae TaxID=3043614 RepID=A0ABT6RZ55_9ACTN|nr:diaminopimelate epimerase [Streptomyces sp. B-S-A8]MDI3389610.1 diaminopimelate epimerase [Streptomyces sp. B-S-A8]